MRCWKCNAELEEDAIFCQECGAKMEDEIREGVSDDTQSEETIFCPLCGKKIAADSVFCPECGRRVDGVGAGAPDSVDHSADNSNAGNGFAEANMGTTGSQAGNAEGGNFQQPVYKPKKKMSGLAVFIIFVIVALALILGIIFGIRHFIYKDAGENPLQSAVDQQIAGDTEDADMEKNDDVDMSDVDIDATASQTCTLEGRVKKSKSNAWVLSWDDELSIYGLDEDSEKVLAEDVTNVYMDTSLLEEGTIDNVAANADVKVQGNIYFEGNSIYMEAQKIVDEDGTEIQPAVKPEKSTSSASTAKSSAPATNNDYVIAASASRYLDDGDVAGLSLQEINYAKNEIYARHGRLFDSPELQNYFNSKSWYNGTVAPGNFSDSMLSDVEKHNAQYLRDIEFGINANGYQLDQ